MSTQSRRLFRGKLNDCEQDEDHREDAFDYGAFVTDKLEEDEDDTSLIFVVRWTLASPKVEEENWRTSIFQMLVHCGNQIKKLIIEEGNCMNVVSSFMVECLKLPIEPHPYKVA